MDLTMSAQSVTSFQKQPYSDMSLGTLLTENHPIECSTIGSPTYSSINETAVARGSPARERIPPGLDGFFKSADDYEVIRANRTGDDLRQRTKEDSDGKSPLDLTSHVREYPNPVFQDGKFAVDERLDRNREYWTKNLIEMLRQEGIIPTDVEVNLTPNSPEQPFCLSQSVIRLIEQEPEVYQVPSFPKGVPSANRTRQPTSRYAFAQRTATSSAEDTDRQSHLDSAERTPWRQTDLQTRMQQSWKPVQTEEISWNPATDLYAWPNPVDDLDRTNTVSHSSPMALPSEMGSISR